MTALPTFHAKAVAETQARTESAIDQSKQADEFLSLLDELLEDTH